MSKIHPNTLRMLPESFKLGAHPAMTTIYFEDNLGRVWSVTIDTRFQKQPRAHVSYVPTPPENWREMTADDISLHQSKTFLDWLSTLERKDG